MPLNQDDSANRSRRHYTSIPDYQVVISRGYGLGCCVWCGKVGPDLPDEHDCWPNVTAAEVFEGVRPMFPRTMLDHALEYAAAGRRVFPCQPRGDWAKAPLTPKGTPDKPGGFHYATTDRDQIKAWWTQWPDAMIGGPVPDDQLVIDLDPYHGGDLDELQALVGPLPATLTAWSGREDGGRHFYFAKPDGLLTGSRLPKGWDLRKGGANYCILPPSVHHLTGRPYRWDERPVAPLPDGLLTLLRPLLTTYEAPLGLPTAGKLAGILKRMGEETTNRNNVLLWGLCRLRQAGYPQTALDTLASVARATGLSDTEVAKVMDNSITQAQKRVA